MLLRIWSQHAQLLANLVQDTLFGWSDTASAWFVTIKHCFLVVADWQSVWKLGYMRIG